MQILSERERKERLRNGRSKESELNYAIFAYATRCMAEGDLDALRQVGFVPEDIPVLDQIRLSDLHALSASRAHALKVQIDRAALQWLLERVRRRRTREMLKLELLRLEAPFPMMTKLFGMTPREFATVREAIGVSGGLGRPKINFDDDESQLWRLWVLLADLSRPDKLRQDDLWLVIGREQPSALRTAWHAIQRWAQDPVTLRSLESERAQLSDDVIVQEEVMLRRKHGIKPIGIDSTSQQLPDPPANDDGTQSAA